MPLVNCELKFILTWLEDCVFSSVNERAKFKITVTKLYVPVSTLSTQDLALEEQLTGININQTFH